MIDFSQINLLNQIILSFTFLLAAALIIGFSELLVSSQLRATDRKKNKIKIEVKRIIFKPLKLIREIDQITYLSLIKILILLTLCFSCWGSFFYTQQGDLKLSPYLYYLFSFSLFIFFNIFNEIDRFSAETYLKKRDEGYYLLLLFVNLVLVYITMGLTFGTLNFDTISLIQSLEYKSIPFIGALQNPPLFILSLSILTSFRAYCMQVKSTSNFIISSFFYINLILFLVNMFLSGLNILNYYPYKIFFVFLLAIGIELFHINGFSRLDKLIDNQIKKIMPFNLFILAASLVVNIAF